MNRPIDFFWSIRLVHGIWSLSQPRPGSKGFLRAILKLLPNLLALVVAVGFSSFIYFADEPGKRLAKNWAPLMSFVINMRLLVSFIAKFDTFLAMINLKPGVSVKRANKKLKE